jgi:uncharacterized protein involved in exopolysaccharide biosynthesis
MDNYAAHESHELDLGVAKLLIRYWAQRRLIVTTVAVGLVLGLGLYLMKGKKYSATCTYAPPSSTNKGLIGSIAASNPELIALASRFTDVEAPTARFVQALGLRTVREAVCERYDLQAVYKADSLLKAADALQSKTSVRTTNGGFIEVAVTERDPQLAADIANAYGDELNSFLKSVATTRAGRMRAFLEERLTRVKQELVDAENALATFKSQNRTVDLAASAKQGMEVYARLMARELELETTLEALRSYQTDNSPEVSLVKAELCALRAKIHSVEGRPADQKTAGLQTSGMPVMGPIPTLSDLPEVALTEMRLLREFKVREKLFEYLTAELESARLQEAGSMPVLSTIEPAVPPEKSSSMGFVMTMGLFGVLSSVAALLLVNVREQLHLARAIAQAPHPTPALSAALLAGGNGGNGNGNGNGKGGNGGYHPHGKTKSSTRLVSENAE